ncbi:hypothetical protein ACMFMF_009018 [Clarireedia jacksonii]
MDSDPAAYDNNQSPVNDSVNTGTSAETPKSTSSSASTTRESPHTRVSKSATNRFQCPQCPKNFTRIENLTRHQANHDDVGKFACVICRKRFTRSDLLNRHRRIHVQNDASREPLRSHVTSQSVSPSLSEHQSIVNLVHRDAHSASPCVAIRPDVYESSLPPGMSPHRENLPSIQDIGFSGHTPMSQSQGLSSLVQAALGPPPIENDFQISAQEALNPSVWDGFMLYNEHPPIYMGSYDADISWTMDCLSQDSWSYMDLDLGVADTQLCKPALPVAIDRTHNDPDVDGENVGTDHWPDKVSGSESPPRWIPKPAPRVNPGFWQVVLQEARLSNISTGPRHRITDEIRAPMVDMLQTESPSEPIILEVNSSTFPPSDVLDYFLHLFFQHIHPRFPIVHIPTFNVFTTSPLVLVSMMFLGSSHSKADRGRFVHLFHNRVRVASMRLHEIEEKHLRLIDNIFLLLNLCIAGAWSGDKIRFEFAEGIFDCQYAALFNVQPYISKAETTNCVFPCPDQHWDAPSPQAWKMLLGPANMPPATYYLHALNGILLHKWTKPPPPVIPTTSFGKNLLLYAIHALIFDWRTSVSMLNPTGLMGAIGNHALDIGAGLLSRRRWLIDALDSIEECYGPDLSTANKLLRELGYVSLDVSLSDVHLMAGRSVNKQDSEFAAVNLKYWANSVIVDGTMNHVYEMLRLCEACIRNDEVGGGIGIADASYEIAVALFTGGMVCWVYAKLRNGLCDSERAEMMGRVRAAGEGLMNMGCWRMGEMFGRILMGFGM